MRGTRSPEVEMLLGLNSLSHLAIELAFDCVGGLIDESELTEDLEAVKKAQFFCDELTTRQLSPQALAVLHYFRANSWAAYRKANDPERIRKLDWEQPEAEQEILNLRRALNSPGFNDLDPRWKVQILTNLASRMSELGRPFDAITYWDSALAIDPNFGMALGNRGTGFSKMADYLYDEGHIHVYLTLACKDLAKAIQSSSTYEDVRPFFQLEFDQIKKFAHECEHIENPKEFSLGKSKAEKEYRQWCLKSRLFLNPLNDVLPKSISARDVFAMPSMTTATPTLPPYFGLFNQLKQEFVSARYLAFEAISRSSVHFSDKDVYLANTRDYPCFGLSFEQMKIAYRSAYSLLDKIAFFIRNYFGLELKENRVYFRTIWYKDGEKKNGLEPKLTAKTNLPLRGLFWLSKDLFHDDEDFRTAIEPQAQRLHEIRNFLEHKYVRLHSSQWRASALDQTMGEPNLWLSMSASDFEEKMLHILKVARAGITYLSLAVHSEESRRKAKYPKGKSAVMDIEEWDDEWKRNW